MQILRDRLDVVRQELETAASAARRPPDSDARLSRSARSARPALSRQQRLRSQQVRAALLTAAQIDPVARRAVALVQSLASREDRGSASAPLLLGKVRAPLSAATSLSAAAPPGNLRLLGFRWSAGRRLRLGPEGNRECQKRKDSDEPTYIHAILPRPATLIIGIGSSSQPNGR